jgi:hypothetical protein
VCTHADYPTLRCLPDALSRLTALTAISLWRCGGLQHMFSGAGQLCSLQQLKLTGCARLLELPDGLGSSNAALELLHVDGEWIRVPTLVSCSDCCLLRHNTALELLHIDGEQIMWMVITHFSCSDCCL